MRAGNTAQQSIRAGQGRAGHNSMQHKTGWYMGLGQAGHGMAGQGWE